MKKVEIWQVEEWNWVCPDCGQQNSFTIDPEDYKIVKCGSCEQKFKTILEKE